MCAQLPGYVGDYDKLTKAGAELIACVTVNDAFVAAAWGEANGADGKVHILLICLLCHPFTLRSASSMKML